MISKLLTDFRMLALLPNENQYNKNKNHDTIQTNQSSALSKVEEYHQNSWRNSSEISRYLILQVIADKIANGYEKQVPPICDTVTGALHQSKAIHFYISLYSDLWP